nr:immunoglobulin light chain junction region [Macaca mulatta]MOW02692.1 immunoglobulin light chain junction region [Macaca mulatta]
DYYCYSIHSSDYHGLF